MKACHLALLLALLVPCASAQTRYTWNGGSGTWDDAARWTPTGIPAAADTVVIASGTATLTANTTVAGFHLPNLGAIDGNADLTITASMVWSGGGPGFDALRGAGKVTVAPGATLLMAGPTTNYGAVKGRVFVNAGTAMWTGPGRWDDTGHFVNEGDLDLAFDTPTSQLVCFSSEADAISNGPAGVIRRTGMGEARLTCGFSNAGTVRVESGSLALRGFNATGGTDTGAYDVEAAGTLVFMGGNRTMTASASISGEGTIEVHGGATALAGVYDVGATRFVTGAGVFNLDGESATDTLAITSGTLGGSGTLTVTDGFIWKGGVMRGSGTTVVDAGISLDIGTAAVSLSDSRTLRLSGSTTWSGAVGINNGSSAVTLVNAGTFTSTGPGERTFFAGTFSNEGTFVHDAGTVRFSSGFDNAGTVRVDGGTLRLQGFNATGGTDTGTYTVADSARLEFTGGNRTLAASAQVAGTGTVAFLGGSVTNGATWRPGASPGRLTVGSRYPAGNGVLEVEIGGYAPGTAYDQLAVTGTATLGGTLRVVLTDGFTPQAGDRFLVVPASTVSGTFAALDLPAGLSAAVEVTPSGAELVFGTPVANEDEGLPTAFALQAAYPNPFRDQAVLRYDVPTGGLVRIAVYDLLGREVALLVDEIQAAGAHEARLDGALLPNGAYLVRMEAGRFMQARWVTLVR